jgi:hypothetical protein
MHLKILSSMLVCLGVIGCKPKQGSQPNYGSSLQAVGVVTAAVRTFFEQNATYPFFVGGLTNLEEYGSSEQFRGMVLLLDTNSVSTELRSNTIVVVAVRPTSDPQFGAFRYVGLLSGEIALTPNTNAHLGAALLDSQKRTIMPQ